MALSMGDPMFDAELNPVFADEGSKAREAPWRMLLSYFADELITPSIMPASYAAHRLLGRHGHVPPGLAGLRRPSATTPNVHPGPQRGVPAAARRALHVVASRPRWASAPAVTNREAAYQFIEWYTSPENQTAIYDAFGLYPSRPSVAAELNEEGNIAGYDVIVEQANYRQRAATRRALVGSVHGGGLAAPSSRRPRSPTGGDVDANAVIDQLAQDWNDLKAEYE